MPDNKAKNSILSQSTNQTSCLELINKGNLDESLVKCNLLIERSPSDPLLIIDRSLIHIMNGQTSLACKDIKDVFTILNTQKKEIDPLLYYQITVRKNSCAKH